MKENTNTAAPEVIIELKDICKSYGDLEVLRNVNATIRSGEVIAIIGPSGSGKSTLLNCINVLDRATSGQVFFEGTDIMDPKCDVKKYRLKMGMVFQQFNLFGHMTVLENVMNPQLDLLERDRQYACDKAMECLRLVGMADRIWHYPHELSGGQKQRAAIARVLALDSEVLLLDEPTSALDPAMVGEVEYVIKSLADMGKTMIIVTHEMRLAKNVATRVFYMDEKHIYEDGPAEEIFANPKGEKTRRFIGGIKTLELTVSSPDFDFIGATTEIQKFCFRQYFDIRRMKHVQLLFEELCIIKLIPHVFGSSCLQLDPAQAGGGSGGRIEILFEYEDSSDTLTLNLKHTGKPALDRILASSSMESKIIRGMTDEIKVVETIIDQE